jgi:fatty acid desaturase
MASSSQDIAAGGQRGWLRTIIGDFLAASSRRTTHSKTVRAGPLGDYPQLKAEIKRLGLLDRQPAYYAWKAAQTLAFVLLGAAWVGLTRGTHLVWFGAPLLAFASAQLTLLGHDAAHRAIFASPRANDLLALVCINALNGGSYRWWATSHNEHHARSGDLTRDPDLDYPFLAFNEAQAQLKSPRFRPVLARQHALIVAFATLVGFTLRAYSVVSLARGRGARGEAPATALFYLVYPYLMVTALGPARAALFTLAALAFNGLILASITAPGHWAMPMPEATHAMDFVRHQVTTSRNLAGGALVDLWYGGLNLQIEHHLFPTMARNNLRRAREVVRAFCAERGISYHEVSPGVAYGEIYSTLRRVARYVRDKVD